LQVILVNINDNNNVMQVRCKNKREGKQLAAQAVLQLMHPQLTTWGSLLRLYSKADEAKEKKVCCMHHVVVCQHCFT